MPNNLGIDSKNKSLACSEQKLQIWACLSHYGWPNWPKMAKWPQKAIWALRSIWGIWKWSQWISDAQTPGDRHQKQVSSMLRTKVTNLGMFIALWLAELAKKGHFGHSGQSEVSENGPNEFLIPKNLGIDTKNKSLACSEPKLQIWACLSHYESLGASYVKIRLNLYIYVEIPS